MEKFYYVVTNLNFLLSSFTITSSCLQYMRTAIAIARDRTMFAPVDKYSSYGRHLPLVNALSFFVMITINVAVGSKVRQVSDKYTTMITPASYAFSIWTVIYFSLATFIIWGFLPKHRNDELLFCDIGYWFALSSLFNTIWIVVFVQGSVTTLWISSVFLFLIVGSLVIIIIRSNAWSRESSRSACKRFLDAFIVDWTFSIYAGWTLAASILNVSLSLVGSGFYGGDHQESWAKSILVFAGVVYYVVMIKQLNWAFGVAGAWALFAISKNHSTCLRVLNLVDTTESCNDVQIWAFGIAICIAVLTLILLIVALSRSTFA